MTRHASWPIVLSLGLALTAAARADDFESSWAKQPDRVWIGPEYWANPLQDWRLAGGRLECAVGGGNRNVSLLTHQVSTRPGGFQMSVRLGRLDGDGKKLDKGFVGFYVGVKGPLEEYRNNALHGTGISAGVTTDGRLVLGKTTGDPFLSGPAGIGQTGKIELRFSAEPAGEAYRAMVSAHDAASGKRLGQIVQTLTGDELAGNLALVSSRDAANPRRPDGRGGNVRFWFSDWKVSGSKIEGHPEQAFGPILFAQHTLSRGVLKMTAQMPPIGRQDAQSVRLEIRSRDTQGWTAAGEATIDALARTATFRIEDWDASRDTPYRLVYALAGADGRPADHSWEGTIRRDPVDKDQIVVAGFTGNQDYAFPNHVLAENVKRQRPDVLFFSGDQIYEGVAGYGTERSPLEKVCLDYLRKWYLFGWAFGDLMRDRPSISIPDDHDVYQGNIWGAGGRKIDRGDRGGYVMPAVWVNMVERTQTSHLPDPYDPTPVEQGIGVYYTAMTYGRISFAIIEDRKFKSGPADVFKHGGPRPDHITDPNFDPRTADVPGAKLLGERQLDFLDDWAADWRGAEMKVALSQTIFANVASVHGGGNLRLVADLDANGWPQTGRNKALDALRRCFAVHIAGDQHLPSIVHHGIDDFGDAVWSLCVPSIAAGYPRSWEPLAPGKNRRPGAPEYTGEFLDGLGNHITVWAVANPQEVIRRKNIIQMARDRASGYGIAKLNKSDRQITLECWPLDVDPAHPGQDGQFAGWPKTIRMEENYARRAAAYLPTIQVDGMTDPVVQVVDESDGRIVYTLRIKGKSYRPKVFQEGTYTVKVGDPDAPEMRTIKGVRSLPPDKAGTLDVKF